MKKRITVCLNDLNKIKNFTKSVSTFSCNIDLVNGKYVIDAKSVVGIFTIDLSAPVDVIIHSDKEEDIIKFNEVMKEFE